MEQNGEHLHSEQKLRKWIMIRSKLRFFPKFLLYTFHLSVSHHRGASSEVGHVYLRR